MTGLRSFLRMCLRLVLTHPEQLYLWAALFAWEFWYEEGRGFLPAFLLTLFALVTVLGRMADRPQPVAVFYEKGPRA